MICNELYNGQGLGNQLWNYALLRIIADTKKIPFSVLGRNKFKGQEFLDLDFGHKLFGGLSPEGGPPYKLPKGIKNYYREKRENLKNTKINISRTDMNLLNIPDNTKFDGNCQSTKYLDGQKENILKWIKIKEEYKKYATDENTCVIHIRCGDYKNIKDVFLPIDYYRQAMNYIKIKNKNVKFCCVTDQKKEVEKMLPGIEIIGSSKEVNEDKIKAEHHYGGPIGIDFCLLMNAKYLIIPNSSFSWWAAYLNTSKKIVIAPKYWSSYKKSIGYWASSDIITEGFTYLDREGKIFSSQECSREKEEFENKNKEIFTLDQSVKNELCSFKYFISLKIKHKIGKLKNKIIHFIERFS